MPPSEDREREEAIIRYSGRDQGPKLLNSVRITLNRTDMEDRLWMTQF